MKDYERKFLLAVEKGELATVKALIESKNPRVDINCFDPLSRNALTIAINNENLEMVKLLIEAGILIGDALLYAIDENFVEAVELLLDHYETTLKTTSHPSFVFPDNDSRHCFFGADMTPLMLAAHRNNFEVIKMLLDRGVANIQDPHDPRCDCKACCTARSEDCLRHSSARINAYRALASPCLMALSSQDPLLTAFEMSARLESLSYLEPEYKSDYMKLRAQCQTFATNLLDYTRTSKELEILLNYSDEFLDTPNLDQQHQHQHQHTKLEVASRNVGNQRSLLEMSSATGSSCSVSMNQTSSSERRFISYRAGSSHHHLASSNQSLDSVTGRQESYRSHMRLARLRIAIKCGQKTFCAHPNIQELLANMWYENLPGFRRRNMLAQMSQVIFIGLMFPLYSVAYLVAPRSQLGRYIKKPFIKFICHSASYITFLIVLLLASQRVEAFYSWQSIISLFSRDHPQHPGSSSAAAASASSQQQLKVYIDSPEQMAALYKQAGGVIGAGSSSARGLDNLSRIFEQLPPSSKKRGALPSPIELLILLWVVSLIWAEIKQLRALGMNYYKADMWNALDSVASGFYIGAIILRVLSYLQSDEKSVKVVRERWDPHDPTLVSEGLFAAATIFSSLKLVYIFSINPYLGPLQISISRMIIDIVRFSWIYVLVLFSFACGMNQLLWYYADLERHQCLNITNYQLVQYYSMQHQQASTRGAPQIHLNSSHPTSQTTSDNYYYYSSSSASNASFDAAASSSAGNSDEAMTRLASSINNTTANMSDDKIMDSALSASFDDDSSKPPVTFDESCRTWRYFSNVFESSQTLFWATFGLVDLENFELTGIRDYTRFCALLMFGCYCFINVVVVLNLLIAMMNHSYVKISKRSDIEWKFARTKLWMSYFDTGSTVPAPFNIVPSMKSVSNVVHYVVFRMCCQAAKSSSSYFAARKLSKPGRTSTSLDLTALKSSAQRLPYDLPSIDSFGFDRRRPAAGATGPKRELIRINYALTASYRSVIRSLVCRYLVNEQRKLEKKRNLTEAKLHRWARLNAFEH